MTRDSRAFGDKPPRVKIVRAKGRRYTYFDHGAEALDGPRLERLPDIDSDDFAAAYSSKLVAWEAEQRRPKTITQLVRRYQLDRRFLSLAPATQTLYASLHRDLLSLGPRDPATVKGGEIEAIAGQLKDGSGYVFRKVTRALFNWAVEQGFVERSPIQDSRPQEWIYFVGAGDGHPIKIGRTNCLEKRLSMLQVGSPHQLRVLASYVADNAIAGERRLHTRFAAHALRGEWFEAHPDILAEIERLNA